MKKRILATLLAVLMVVSVLGLAGATGVAAQQSWQIQTVGDEGVGAFNSLTLDSSGHPHIAYMEQKSADLTTYQRYYLKYASYDGSKWNSMTVDDAGEDTGRYLSLAVDSTDHPHIVYQEIESASSNYLKYASYDGSKWNIETIDHADGYGLLFSSLALDASDHPHICYEDQVTAQLKYATYDGSRWNIEIVNSGELDQGCQLAVSSSGQPHIIFHANSYPGYWKYATNDGSGWKFDTLPLPKSWGDMASIAVDSHGHPHISTTITNSDSDFQLVYVTNDGSGWTSTIVDKGSAVGYASIATDANDHPHIAYWDGGSYPTYSVKYAANDGTGWTVEPIDTWPKEGVYFYPGIISLALDKTSYTPHVSYAANWNNPDDPYQTHYLGNLRYATVQVNAPPVAKATTPTPTVTVFDKVSLDGSGSYDKEGSPLTYAWSITEKPAGSSATISDPIAQKTSFVPDVVGTYKVQLVANDGSVDSSPSVITVTANAPTPTTTTSDTTDTQTTIQDLYKSTPAAFTNANSANALTNKLDAVKADIAAGNYAAALSKLQHDILPKTDGCHNGVTPDANDWIKDCATQKIVYDQVATLIKELQML